MPTHRSLLPSAASIIVLCLLLGTPACSEEALAWLSMSHDNENACSGGECDAGTGCTEGECLPACPPGAVRVDRDCEWTYSELAAGSSHTCGIRAETGAVACWGQSYGAAGWPRDVAFKQVSTGWDLSCGILRDSGSIRCWGGTAPSDLPTSGSFSQVSVYRGDSSGGGSGMAVCAIRAEDSHVQCWTSDSCDAPLTAPEGVAFSAITVGWDFGCGIRRDDSRIQCWGRYGMTVPEGEVCSLSENWSQTVGACALRCNGEAVCFGSYLSDQAVPATERFRELQVGAHHVCGIREADGTIGCWMHSQPVAAPEGAGYEQLAVGGDDRSINMNLEAPAPMHACVLRKDDGRLICWGNDEVGQVSGAPSFTRFKGLAIAVHRSGGTMDAPIDTICGLRDRDQLVQCWGGGTSTVALDVPLTALSSTSCGIRAADSFSTCWDAYAPNTALSELDDTNSIACGIRAADHNAVCWTQPAASGEIEAPQGLALKGLTVGNGHACALRESDHHAVCWGDDRGGPISDMPRDVAFRQLQAEKLADPRYGFIADAQTCGIREADGVVQCWGTRDALFTQARPISPLWKLSKIGDCGLSLDTHEAVCATLGGEDAREMPGVRFQSVENGIVVRCGIRESDGLLTCWGGVLWNPI